MISHKRIQKLLYEYIQKELHETEYAKVETHLARCPRCTQALSELRVTLENFSAVSNKPSEERPQEYWSNFALQVENRIIGEQQKEQRFVFPLRHRFEMFVMFHRRLAAAIGSGLAIVIIAVTLWQWHRPSPQEKVEQLFVSQSPPVQTIDEHLGDYFRKTKVLLIGVSNIKIPGNNPIDFSFERERSYELIHQARYLKSQPLDRRSRQLIDDLEKILIELSSLEEKNNLPNIEIIRAGIYQKNILFKIRMAEAMYNKQPMIITNTNF